jgi:Fe-S oxidoreductase
MTFESILFALLLLAAFVLFAYNVRRLVHYLCIGKPVSRSDDRGQRLKNVLGIAFGQTKLLREPLAGILHLMIFWGFVILLASVAESIGEGVIPGFSFAFLGPLYGPLVFAEELAGVLVAGAVLFSIGRRLLAPPKRLQVSGHAKWDAILILGLILTVMITMFGQNTARIVAGHGGGDGVRFVSGALARLFGGPPQEGAVPWYHAFFWAHMLVVLGFMNYLPYSKHLHILTSVPNVFFSDLGPRGALASLNLADETLTKYGATDVDDLTWKQLLDGFSCTECGRCTAACPANSTGKMLSPREIIVSTRARTMEKAPLLIRAAGNGNRDSVLAHQLLDNFVTERELWACTSCMACVQECPVMIEHVGTIVELRRGLVLNESRFPEELKATFSNLERNFTPWAFGHATRADWAEGLDIPRLAEVRKTDVLFWVGCAGAYDARYRKVSQAFARLLKLAGVNFAILGTEEKCNGDAARRMGNEYLAQMLIGENIATLAKYQFNRIVVTCPHCFHSLGKEYRQFGGAYEVVHHSVLLRELVASGRLKLSRGMDARVTFHDPCYLGRYEGEYGAPRAILDAVRGVERVEMKRTKDRSFCCGAGGGRMWMEETEGKRINVERTEEALSLKPDVIGTECPFCLTMLSDGLKTKGVENVRVRDIAELLLEAAEMREGSPPAGNGADTGSQG